MRRILLLTAIFLSGCIDVDVQTDADSPEITPTETISLYVDNFNNYPSILHYFCFLIHYFSIIINKKHEPG